MTPDSNGIVRTLIIGFASFGLTAMVLLAGSRLFDPTLIG